MKKSRIKARVLESQDEFLQTVNRIAAIQAEKNVFIAHRDAVIQRLLARYEVKTAPLDEQIKALMTLADAYAEAHRAELLPKGKKSVELGTATYGWRTGNRTVKLLSKVTEEQAIEKLENASLDDYVRETKELAKDKILTDCTDDKTLILPAVVDPNTSKVIYPEEVIQLSDCGLRITQAEAFYIEPKVQSGETLKAPEASAA